MNYFLEFDTSKFSENEAQVIVCGSGIAGLATALYLKEIGLNPVIITRGIGNTYFSQGGIAGAVLPDDSPYLHYCDTLKAGRYLNHETHTRILTYEGILRIVDLERWGVNFDKKDGFYETTLEGGHSKPRVLKVKDYTGREIYTKLLNKVEEYKIPIIEGETQEILIRENTVQGILYAAKDGSLNFVRTAFVVLATGGAASMYYYTSNPQKVRGDGIGIALRVGANVKNPEFIQFHPTVLKNSNLLISEAVRGEGAILVNDKGERFVDELLPRDEVARAIYRQLKGGRKVFLDFSPLVKKGIKLEERFPTIYGFLKEKGLNPYTDLIPVNPAAHYYIGGIEVDDRGRTAVNGLYAVGECSCTGVHGANRLASNSLLEGIVFGFRAAYQIALETKLYKISKTHFKNERKGNSKPSFGIKKLKKLMWDKVGLERNEKDLSEAKEILSRWIKESVNWEPTFSNRQLLDILLVAFCTVEGALSRKESRGVHFRKDFPYERDTYRRDTIITRESYLEILNLF
ncbi:MAG TPA: L-aspartate oxidase [Aquifex aeolicus]|nr:L-aspartate oxidase [Aquifex aeolicus]